VKKCPRCKTEKPVKKFAPDASRKDGRRSWCKKCQSNDDAKPERRAHRAERHARTQYGIGVEEISEMARRQNNLCAICKTDFGARGHVDHDHATKKVRGLLCGWCNRGLGEFKDSEKSLTAAVAYLVRARIGMLKGSGNAIVPALAAEFIRAFREALNVVKG